jgi:hypothetical protein
MDASMLPLLLATALLASTPAPDPGQQPRPQRYDGRTLLHVEPAYYDVAAATGGDFYFWAPGEFAAAALHLPIDGEAVVLDYGRLAQPRRSVAIPVESGVRELTVFAGAQRKDRAVLVRPDGAIVADGGGDARLQTYSHMLLATIREPPAGTWRLEFDGAGLYSLSALGRGAGHESAPQLVEFEFVERGGRPAHEGWFPIQRDLRAGETIRCRAWVAGAVSDLRFGFVTGDAQPLGSVAMAPPEPDYPDHLAGQCLVPKVPFRVVVSGRDERGQPFRRIEPALLAPR